MNAASVVKPRLSTSLALSSLPLLFFLYTLLNGYFLNLVGGYQANPWLVLAGVMIELALTLAVARNLVSVEWDGLECAAWLVVVGSVWAYFVSASLPTLLPPTQSVDAVRHYLQASFSYSQGTLVSWYPAGGAFIVAMFSNWLFTLPLRMLHPIATLFIALSAGAVYGITSDILPLRRLSKITALVAPALLFLPWSYFAGIVNWEQYFFAQVAAQYFVVAALWFVVSHSETPHWVFLVLFGATLLGIVAAYPYLVVLPLGLFVLVLLTRVVSGNWSSPAVRRSLLALAVIGALFVLVIAALERGGILELKTFTIATQGDVGDGGVTNPSLDALGGPVFLVLTLMGIVRAWKTGTRGRTIIAFLAAWLFQLGALLLVQPFLRISGYRLDKTFYILVFPLAILAALIPAWIVERWEARSEFVSRHAPPALAATLALLAVSIVLLRPPKIYSPLSQSELQTAMWAKEHLPTTNINALGTDTVQAYWIAVGLWRETLPSEYFQWIPAGPKLGPNRIEDWMDDPAWGDYLYVGDVTRLAGPLPTVVYRNGASAILSKPTPVSARPGPTNSASFQFEYYAKLVGFDLMRTTYRPGETIRLTTYSESLLPPPATVAWRVELIDRAGNAVSKASADPFGGKYPLQRWPAGRYARDEWSLPLDNSLSPGLYHLQLGLYRRVGGEALDVATRTDTGELVHSYAALLADIKVPIVPPPATELDAANPIGVTFGDSVKLLGYRLEPNRSARTVRLVLYWQGSRRTMTDYTIFVHLLDESGSIVAQKDAAPREGSYPTSIWDPGEVVSTEYEFSILPNVPLPTAIEIGMYTLPGLQRLPAGDSDHITLPIPP